jgi:GTP-binding protein HflX
VLERIDAMLIEDPIVSMRLRIPQSEGKVLAKVEANARIISRSFRGGNVNLEVQATESFLRSLESFEVRGRAKLNGPAAKER